MYNHKIMSRLYFENIKFNNENRLLRVFDGKGGDVLSGNLGVPLGTNKPFACREKPKDGSACWEWTQQAKLYINLDSKFTGVSSDDEPVTKCYNFRWEALDENFHPIDCFNIGEERGQWYGGGLTTDADWQLERGSFGFAPFVTGDIRLSKPFQVTNFFTNSLIFSLQVSSVGKRHQALLHKLTWCRDCHRRSHATPHLHQRRI